MTKKFKILGLIFIVVIIIMFAPVQYDDKLEIYYLHGQYALDVENPYEVVGFSDYVFVAKVDEKIRTIYEYNKVDKRMHVYKITGEPYTQYPITVIENIKGDIEKNIPITLEQFGGVSSDKRYIQLMEGDEILESGSFYIIVASSRRDGRLSLFSPRGYKKMRIENETEIFDTQEYKDFVEYRENEVMFDRKRFNSKYNEQN